MHVARYWPCGGEGWGSGRGANLATNLEHCLIYSPQPLIVFANSVTNGITNSINERITNSTNLEHGLIVTFTLAVGHGRRHDGVAFNGHAPARVDRPLVLEVTV